jgi:hypothetical protein
MDQTLTQGSGGLDGDLLTQDGAHGQLETIQAPRQTLAHGVWKCGLKHLRDGGRLGIQVQPVAHLRYQGGQHGQQVGADAKMDPRAHAVPADRQPPAYHADAMWPANGAAQFGLRTFAAPALHALQRTAFEKLPQLRDLARWPVVQHQRKWHAANGCGLALRAGRAKLSRAESVML